MWSLLEELALGVQREGLVLLLCVSLLSRMTGCEKSHVPYWEFTNSFSY